MSASLASDFSFSHQHTHQQYSHSLNILNTIFCLRSLKMAMHASSLEFQIGQPSDWNKENKTKNNINNNNNVGPEQNKTLRKKKRNVRFMFRCFDSNKLCVYECVFVFFLHISLSFSFISGSQWAKKVRFDRSTENIDDFTWSKIQNTRT